MKASVALGTVLLLACMATLGVFFLRSNDVVTSRYPTLAAARSDNLFARGWLPDILPPSTTNIRTSNDLDVNTSEGEFSFAPSDYSLFVSRVQPYKSVTSSFAEFEKDAARMQSKGFVLSTFSEEHTTWVFFCKPNEGHCEYSMRVRRG